MVIFSAKFFGYHFRDGLQPETRLHFRSTSAIETCGVFKGHWMSEKTNLTTAWIWISTHRGGQQALRYDENSSSIKPTRICQASKTGPVLLAVPRYPLRHASGITTSCWDVVVVIVSTTRAVAMLRNLNSCLVGDEEGSRRLGASC